MPKILVPLAHGFEEIEAVTVIDILRRAGVEVVVAGLEPGPVEGRSRIRIVPDTTLEAVLPQVDSLDMIVLPGGLPGTTYLRQDPRVRELIQKLYALGRHTAAICAAPTVLSAVGILKGRRVTSHPSVEQELREQSDYRDDRVVVDGQVITSRAPGTAMEFAMTLVEILVGKEKVEEINRGVMARL